MTLVCVDDALALIRDHAPAPRPADIALQEAHDRILLAPVIATRDQPPFDAAAMDGYALTAPLSEDESVTVIGESQAGRAFAGALTAGSAVRVFTGTPLPLGATRVIVQEDVVRDGDVIQLRGGANPAGKPHVRPRGCDFRTGDILLQSGDRLSAWRLALVAATGVARLTVAERPRIALVCTGDELVPPGQVARDDQVFEANAVALAALARRWGAEIDPSAHIGDDKTTLTTALRDTTADILVTIGGASVGDYDLIRPALETLGIRWLFEKVDLKPGRPTAFGRLDDGRRVLCLPGNPGSALVCAQLFLKPLIEAACGAQIASPVRALPCATGLPANGPRETYLRAVTLAGPPGAPTLLPLSDQDCSQVHAFAITSALIRRRAHAPAVVAGETCECLWLAE